MLDQVRNDNGTILCDAKAIANAVHWPFSPLLDPPVVLVQDFYHSKRTKHFVLDVHVVVAPLVRVRRNRDWSQLHTTINARVEQDVGKCFGEDFRPLVTE